MLRNKPLDLCDRRDEGGRVLQLSNEAHVSKMISQHCRPALARRYGSGSLRTGHRKFSNPRLARDGSCCCSDETLLFEST